MRRCLVPQPILLGLVLTCVAFGAAIATANEAVYQRVVRSTVLIVAPSGGIGTGTFIDVDRRLVVTANHVPGKETNVLVFFADIGVDGQPIADAEHYSKNKARLAIRGTVAAREPRCDLALIRLENVPAGKVPLPLAVEPRPGEQVHAIGHSSIKRNAVFSYSSCGVVRNVYNLKPTAKLPLRGRVIETSLPTNKGDSGGPVVNDKGELVAVVSQGTTGAASPADGPFANEQVVDLDIAVTEVRTLVRRVGLEKMRTPLALAPRATSPGGVRSPMPRPTAPPTIRYYNWPTGPEVDRLRGVVARPTAPPVPVEPIRPTSTLLSELRVSLATAPPPPEQPVSVVGGRWVDTDAGNGFTYTCTFDADGNFRCSEIDAAGVTQSSSKGRYEYVRATGVLVLHLDTRSVPLMITWINRGRLSVRRGTTTNVWKREP